MSTLIVNPSGSKAGKSAYSTISNRENAYTDSSSSTYAQVNLTAGANAITSIGLTFDLSSIPADANINSVKWIAKSTISTTTSSYVPERTIQLYSGDIAKGDLVNIGGFADLTEHDGGIWTRQELEDLYLYFYAKRGTSKTSTTYYIRIYGADLTIEYTSGGVTQTLKIKSNGNWQDVSKVYKKENGEWIEQTELSQVFDTQKNYLKES